MNEQARPSSAELRRARRQARLVTFQDFAASAPAPKGPAGKGGAPHFPPFFATFSQNSTCFCTLFFAFFPILDVSGRVSDAQNHGSMDSSIMDLANEYLISPLAISSSPLWRFQRKSILGQLLKNSAQNGPPEQTDGRTDGRTYGRTENSRGQASLVPRRDFSSRGCWQPHSNE